MRARLTIGALLAAILVSPLRGQQAAAVNEYTLSWTNPANHLYDVSLTFVPEGRDSADVHLPIWRPGRYWRQNFAANVQEFAAEGLGGDPLPFRKTDLSTWRVATGGTRKVTIRYRYYANQLDAGGSFLSSDEAYFNPVNLFMVPAGQMLRPLRLTVQLPKGWRAATALLPGKKPNEFTAPDYHTLADSPTILSPTLRALQFTVDEVPYTVEFQGRFEPGEREDDVVADMEKVVRVQTGIFGGAPFDEYVFLFHLLPYPMGHAVEHASSSSYAIQDNVFASDAGYRSFLGIVAHELFHAWNVKRIRPAALWPYDYMRDQFTTLSWFTEGVTSYYSSLTTRRAGFTSAQQYLAGMGQQIDRLQRTPARKIVSASLASWDSWLTGPGQASPNVGLDFYLKGQILGLLLDALIRDRTDGARSLDDVMRQLFETYYRRGAGVPGEGVRLAAEQVSGASLAEFFERYVDGTHELPYDDLLAPFGLRVRIEVDPSLPEATLRLQTRPRGERPAVVAIDPESPALAAGVDIGDELVAIEGRSAPAQSWEALLADVKPGDTVSVVVLRRNRLLELEVKTAPGGNARHVLERVESPDERQERLFSQWIGSPAG